MPMILRGGGCGFVVVGLLRMEGEELEACDHAGEGASAGAGYDDHVEEGVEVISCETSSKAKRAKPRPPLV